MTPHADDFLAECESIHTLLAGRGDDIFKTPTLFKGWTIGDIMGHLHLWNIAADLTLSDPKAFAVLGGKAMQSLGKGATHPEFQRSYFEGQSDADIFKEWAQTFPAIATRFRAAAPEDRVRWVGPDMSVASCIIARQMEHWAHAQAIFDVLGQDRENTDRLRNVAHIGVTTYSWSFKVRGMEPPRPKPFIDLIAPSGEHWHWNDPQADNRITGSAEQFCQVVTQCRNIKDTNLVCTGDTARQWMDIAQCFAGAAETPPAAGTRHKANSIKADQSAAP